MSSPTQRALADARKMGWVADVVEKWVPQARRRKDLWGWVDIQALDPESGDLYFLQVTSGSNHSARVAKIKEWPYLEALLKPPRHTNAWGRRAEVWSYSQRVVKNKDGSKAKNKKWTLRREKVE